MTISAQGLWVLWCGASAAKAVRLSKRAEPVVDHWIFMLGRLPAP